MDFAALRAMTGLEGESAVILFGFFMQLLKLCGAIQNFDYSVLKFPLSVLRFPYVRFFVHPLAFALRRMARSLFQQLSDCATGIWVNHHIYNTITPTEYCKV
ncbi:MAG: hypothetical protein WCP85_19035 [Mariniphaga sp.]